MTWRPRTKYAALRAKLRNSRPITSRSAVYWYFFPEDECRCPITYFLDKFSTMIAFSDMAAKSRLNEIRETFFALTELTHAEPKEKRGHRNAHQQTRQVQVAMSAQDAPPEPVDDPHHWIERIQQSLLLGHY